MSVRNRALVLAVALSCLALLMWFTSAMALAHSGPVGAILFYVACLPIFVLGGVAESLSMPAVIVFLVGALGEFFYVYAAIRATQFLLSLRKGGGT